MRRHRCRAPAASLVFPSNTCENGHRGQDKGEREGGGTHRSGACVSAGASRGEGEVGGGGLPTATIKWRRRHCVGFSFDTKFL